jgi:hypothetical protein
MAALHEVLKRNGYEPVAVPRDFDGVKSIISFKPGKEFVVSPPQECLANLKVGGGKAQFPLTERQSTCILNAQIGSDYLKSKQVDINLTFERHRIRNILIHLDSVKIEKIYPVTLNEFLEKNTLSNSCSKNFNKKSKYAIIYEAVIVSKLTYSFIKDDSTELLITADIIKVLGFNSNDVVINQNKTTLTINDPLIIGYKAKGISKFINSFSGETRIGTLEDLSLKDIERLKKNI